MQSIQIGDVVVEIGKAKQMTVYEIKKDSVLCKWFEGTKLNSGHFQTNGLTKVGR